jgi:hypothetical protein
LVVWAEVGISYTVLVSTGDFALASVGTSRGIHQNILSALAKLFELFFDLL